MEVLILKIHVFFTLYMTGLIWFVQIVHYPLFKAVLPENFVAYEHRHTHLTGFVAGPQMLAELITAGLLVYFQPDFFGYWANGVGVLLLWGSTFGIQVPLHNKLSQEHNAANIDRLVRSNWIRTVLWTARAICLLIIL